MAIFKTEIPRAKEIFQHYVEELESAGGYVNPHLILHCEPDAAHGALFLSGVPNHEVSLIVPASFAIDYDQESLWKELQEDVLGRVIDSAFISSRICSEGIVPILEMANHNKNGGTVKGVKGMNQVALRGVDFCYGGNDLSRLKTYGIVD